MVDRSQGLVNMNDEGQRLTRMAQTIVRKNKHWHLIVDDFEDATQELVLEAVILEKAYADDGMPGLIEQAMRRAYGRWEYIQRRRHRTEQVSVLGTEDGEAVLDVYLSGTEDEHVSG